MKTFPVKYAAKLETNSSPQRTDQASINKGVEAFKDAKDCKVIVAGGYSQGAAVMHNVISKSLDAGIKGKIAGVALFGDTRNKQDNSHIPNFPTERSRVWCNKNDGVCGGALNVNGGHLSYGSDQINQAAEYLAKLAKGGGGGAGASKGPSASSESPGGNTGKPASSGGESKPKKDGKKDGMKKQGGGKSGYVDIDGVEED